MPLFHRKDDATPGGSTETAVAGAPARASGRRTEADWRAYDSIAEAYDRVFSPQTALVAKDLVALARVSDGDRVLDVGTGTGVAARAAAEAAGADGLVVGVDGSPAMLRMARAHGGRFAAAEAIDLPFRDATFDAVVSVFVIQHFARYETALFDLLRVVRPGGRVAVAVWGASDDEFTRVWRSLAEEYAEKEILDDAYRQVAPWTEHFSDPGRLKDTLHDAGVRDIVIDKRAYRFDMTAEDYLIGREIGATGRFLRQMLGEELWETFRRRSREAFAEQFPPSIHDFRDVNLAVGFKP